MLKRIINRINNISILTVTSVVNLIFTYPAIAQYNDYPNSENQQQYQTTNFNQNITRYIVYVDSDNFQILQRIREIENTAYIRQYNGRRIIQSGVFIRPYNAQQRARELEINGITGVGILQVSTNQEMGNYIPENNRDRTNIDQQSYYEPNYPQNKQQGYDQRPQKVSKAYYVVIPSDRNKMRSLGEEIVQKIGNNATVYLKTQPHGPHIAIGPFSEKSEAQLWNNYIHKIGYNDARLYYGK